LAPEFGQRAGAESATPQPLQLVVEELVGRHRFLGRAAADPGVAHTHLTHMIVRLSQR
jgi:hypothetical protein